MKIERICKTCGKHFWVYESSLLCSNSSGNFCCRKCYNEHMKTLTGEKNHHYTSIMVKCANCGKEFKRVPSHANENKNQFCSWKCKCEYHHNYIEGEKNCNWIGGHAKYKGNFDTVKKKYFRKINFCFVCGTHKNVHIHHIIPYNISHDNSLENLIPVCSKHHRIIECASKKFINTMPDKKLALEYLNIIFRSRQRAVLNYIKHRLVALKILKERKNENC